MFRRLGLVAPLAIMALLFGALAAACGGSEGEDLTMQEYFEKVNAIQEDAATRGESLEAPSPEASEDQVVAGFQQLFRQQAAIFRDAGDQLDSLKAPAEARSPHDKMVKAMRDAADISDNVVGRIRDEASLNELGNFFESEEVVDASNRFVDACVELQGVADKNDVQVDLQCVEG